MINQSALEALYSANYLDNFLDTIENLPDEVQRQISSIKELDIKYQVLLEELDELKQQFCEELDSNVVKKILIHLRDKLIQSQEIGDEKLSIAQNILDTIDNKQRRLDVDFKNLDTEHDEKNEKENICDRSNKRMRRSRFDIMSGCGMSNAEQEENSNNTNNNSNADKMTPISKTNPANKNVSSGQQKKSGSRKKRKQSTRGDDSPPDVTIDPNEPTYCLCEQVSYGEMIGCDNDLCPIEWFHFCCVDLKHKPKGNWFCPKCRGDKPTIMKPRAQFLKELQKYNKDKEEKS